MNRYAVSTIVVISEAGHWNLQMGLYVIGAHSEEEAEGWGYRKMKSTYPDAHQYECLVKLITDTTKE